MGDLDVYVLGAGASYVHGAPLTDDILRHALTKTPQRDQLRPVVDFLADVFHFDAPAGWNASGWRSCPHLVDVLSMVDVALDRKEALAQGYDLDRLRVVRRSLERAIFEALDHALQWRQRGGRRSRATKDLAGRLDPETSAVISFNYDVVADIALARRKDHEFDFRRADHQTLEIGQFEGPFEFLDYGVEFANVEIPLQAPRLFRLFKLHGSFNWLRHKLTGELYFGGMRKAVAAVFRETDVARRAGDLAHVYAEVADLEPVMVTPTHLKDLRNPHLATVWRKAEQTLRAAGRITFIGYSFPGDDIHVKYLLKRALETRAAGPPAIVVVDKIGPNGDDAVRRNYERFFGRDLVAFHGEGFEAWLRDRHTPW